MHLITFARLNAIFFDGKLEASDRSQMEMMIAAISRSMEKFLDRYVHTQDRTEYFNIEDWQRKIHLKGFPIEVVTSVANDAELPPTWATLLIANEDYLVYSQEDNQGKIEFPYSVLTGGSKALRIISRGGMGSFTDAQAGADGVTSGGVGGHTFTSNSARFVDQGVLAGDSLVITGGVDAGTYPIASVDSNTQLTTTSAVGWADGTLSSQTWSITTTRGNNLIANGYEDLVDACGLQVLMLHKGKRNIDIRSESVQGSTTVYERTRFIDIAMHGAQGFSGDVQMILSRYRRHIYP